MRFLQTSFLVSSTLFATVLSVVITLIGLIAVCFWLPVAQYPRITPPGISVTINYPGASVVILGGGLTIVRLTVLVAVVFTESVT